MSDETWFGKSGRASCMRAVTTTGIWRPSQLLRLYAAWYPKDCETLMIAVDMAKLMPR